MKNVWKAAAALALVSALGVSPLAQEGKRVEQKRLALRLEKADASQVLAQLARVLDAKLAFACEHPLPVTIAFERLTPETALAAICETAGLRWELVEGPERVLRVTCAEVPPPPPPGAKSMEVEVRKEVDARGAVSSEVALDLKDAKLEEVLALAADLLEARLLMDTSLGERSVTLKVEKAPLSQVLDAICAQVGARWELAPGEPPTLKVRAK